MWLTRNRDSCGLSLLELMTSLVVVTILVSLTIAAVHGLTARAQRIHCANNLRNLAAAADLYLQQYGSWPQINAGSGDSGEEFADAWIVALMPFGPQRKTWICPTMQGLLHNPGYSTAATARADYFATPFDDKPTSPHEWQRQPWFIERGDVHGNGNLMIFADGSISDVKTVLENNP